MPREGCRCLIRGGAGARGKQISLVTCLVLMLQVQKPGTCGWPLTGCQAAATFTGASCAARSWRTSGTTTTSTSPAGLSVLSVVPPTLVATIFVRTLNSNIPRQERSIWTISWPVRWPYPRQITTRWTRSHKLACVRACSARALPTLIILILIITTTTTTTTTTTFIITTQRR